MDANSHHTDDLSGLERRLASWAPAVEGLNVDAMLFAAGRASVCSSPTRFVWPALACGMAALATVLAVCLRLEHAQRLELAQQFQQLAPAPLAEPSFAPSPPPTESTADEEPPLSSLLVAHRVLERGLEDWPDPKLDRSDKPSTPQPPSSIFQVGQRDVLLDP